VGSIVDGGVVFINAEIVWVGVAILAAMNVVSILWVTANWVESHTAQHDLKVRVAELRAKRLEYLRSNPRAQSVQ